jgi:hypothetical protein
MPTIVDMRPPANTFRHTTLIVIWLVMCLVGLGGCKSNLVKETCIDKPVWTTVVLEEGKFTVESREYDILDGTCTVILDQQITWTEHPQEYNNAMLAYKKRWNNTIDLSCEDFFKMKQLVQTGSKLQAVKHVKESAKCGLKEAKDFVDTYCDYVL